MVLAIMLGLWLRWPCLEAGFFSDDFVQPAMRAGVYPSPRAPLDLFDFAAGNSADNTSLMRYGSLPWWAAPNLRLSMMRPLSSVLIIVDNELFGTHAVPYHLHSLLWWVLVMVAAAALLRELFPSRIAGLAIVLFALEEGHTVPLVWLANRGALVAMFFGIVGLLLHIRARSRQRPLYMWGSFCCFSIALLSGEWAFPLLGYVFAYEVFNRRDALRLRLWSLWPAAMPGAIFLALRAHFQYGALNSGVYIDPITELPAFAVAACQRIPVFFADLFFSVPAMWWGMGTPWRERLLGMHVIPPKLWLALPGWHFWHVLIGCVAIVATVVTLRAGLRDRPAEERRQIRWLLIGALLSLVPMVASFPTSRLVLPASLAASAAAAIVLLRFGELVRAQRSAHRLRAWTSFGVVAVVAYFQVWEAASTSFYEARGMAYTFDALRRWVASSEIDDRTIAKQSVVLVNSVEHSTTMFMPWMRWIYGHPIPRANWVLSAAPSAHDIYRPAPNVLEVAVLGGTLLNSDLEQLYRDDRFPVFVGQTFQTEGFTAQVLRLREGKPQTIRFTFEKNINDPSYLFLYSSPEGLLRARLPEVGQRFRFRKAAFPNADFAQLLHDEIDPALRCVGARSPIDECRVGYAYADCRASNGVWRAEGGEEAVFACHGIGDCRWFSGGCLAEGYVSSPCSSKNLCCLHGWPYDEDAFPSQQPQAHLLGGMLASYGYAPWSAPVDDHFDVSVEPALQSATPWLACSGGPELASSPCGLGRVDVAPPQQSSLRFSFLPASIDGGWSLTVEVVDDRNGALRARVCKVALRPTSPYAHVAPTCPAPALPVCARGGAITLNRFPVEPSRLPLLAAHVRADFDDGTHVDAVF